MFVNFLNTLPSRRILFLKIYIILFIFKIWKGDPLKVCARADVNIPPIAHYSGAPTVSACHISALTWTWTTLTRYTPIWWCACGILTAPAHKYLVCSGNIALMYCFFFVAPVVAWTYKKNSNGKARPTIWTLRKYSTRGCGSSRLVHLFFPCVIFGM
jgi:hypothetical protein